MVILRHWRILGAALIIAGLLAYGLYNRAGWNRTQAALDVLAQQADKVVIALRTATGNDKADWQTAPGQIVALGESNKALKLSVEVQNERIDALAADAVRMKAEAAEMKRIADRAEAQRQSALRRLSDMAITPGTRSDCMILLREAEAALDLVREAGV